MKTKLAVVVSVSLFGIFSLGPIASAKNLNCKSAAANQAAFKIMASRIGTSVQAALKDKNISIATVKEDRKSGISNSQYYDSLAQTFAFRFVTAKGTPMSLECGTGRQQEIVLTLNSHLTDTVHIRDNEGNTIGEYCMADFNLKSAFQSQFGPDNCAGDNYSQFYIMNTREEVSVANANVDTDVCFNGSGAEVSCSQAGAN